jgi:chemotaxis protein CheZ
MEAAEAIGDWLRDGARDVASIEVIASKLNSIFEACTFQDVTGQRIRRAIRHLQQVETMLTEAMPGNPQPVDTRERVVVHADLVQDDVDRVFALGMQQAGLARSAAPDMAQDDIDGMFGSGPPGTEPAVAPDIAQEDIDQMFGRAPARADPALPIAPAATNELGQDDVDRMFG